MPPCPKIQPIYDRLPQNGSHLDSMVCRVRHYEPILKSAILKGGPMKTEREILASLTDRVGHLERQNRLMKAVVLGALVLVLSNMAISCQSKPPASVTHKKVIAQEFVLVNSDGKKRGEWAMDTSDAATPLALLGAGNFDCFAGCRLIRNCRGVAPATRPPRRPSPRHSRFGGRTPRR